MRILRQGRYSRIVLARGKRVISTAIILGACNCKSFHLPNNRLYDTQKPPSVYCRSMSKRTESLDKQMPRKSPRLASTENSEPDNEKAKHVTKIATATAKKTKTVKPKIKSNNITADTVADDLTAGPHPWYYFFTKGDAEYNEYMSTEWGFELRGDQQLFEKLSLDGAQAGLTWYTILRKRQAYRDTFYNFDISRCAAMDEQADVERIMATPNTNNDPRAVVVRHSGKIKSVIHNARIILQMRQEQRDDKNDNDDIIQVFDKFLWSFVDDKPILNNWNGSKSNMPTKSTESEAMSKALKKLGFKFVGPTQIYAFMQAVGMIVDHPVNSADWLAARDRLCKRPGGFTDKSTNNDG